MASHDLEVLSADSLVPKCDELNRMAEALASALDRRAKVLRLSRNMHEQISQVSIRLWEPFMNSLLLFDNGIQKIRRSKDVINNPFLTPALENNTRCV